MRVHVCAVGRVAARTPERALIDDYLSRFGQTARPLGWRFGAEQEVEDKRGGGPGPEAALLRKALPGGAVIVCLDERGRQMASPDLANWLRERANRATSDMAFVIGGADGLAPDLVADADLVLSLGAMVWPHKLARVMLAEQLYRAATILTGGPYHRG